MRNLDITALRSFVAIAEAGGVTRASGFLNLTQSAVSMQIKRLEEVLGLTLLDRKGRTVALTSSGEQLLGYARRMVALNDEIYSRLTDQAIEGEIHLGVPHDIIYPAIPEVMKHMQRDYPRIKINLISSYSKDLKEQFSRGAIDVILTTEPTAGPGGEVLLEVPLGWYGAVNGQAWRGTPLRTAFCSHCGFRPTAMAALEASGRDWESAVVADSDRAIDVAVSADLAVTAILEGHEPPHFEKIPTSANMPDLGTQGIVLYSAPTNRKLLDPLCHFLKLAFRDLQQGPKAVQVA